MQELDNAQSRLGEQALFLKRAAVCRLLQASLINFFLPPSQLVPPESVIRRWSGMDAIVPDATGPGQSRLAEQPTPCARQTPVHRLKSLSIARPTFVWFTLTTTTVLSSGSLF